MLFCNFSKVSSSSNDPYVLPRNEETRQGSLSQRTGTLYGKQHRKVSYSLNSRYINPELGIAKEIGDIVAISRWWVSFRPDRPAKRTKNISEAELDAKRHVHWPINKPAYSTAGDPLAGPRTLHRLSNIPWLMGVTRHGANFYTVTAPITTANAIFPSLFLSSSSRINNTTRDYLSFALIAFHIRATLSIAMNIKGMKSYKSKSQIFLFPVYSSVFYNL